MQNEMYSFKKYVVQEGTGHTWTEEFPQGSIICGIGTEQGEPWIYVMEKMNEPKREPVTFVAYAEEELVEIPGILVGWFRLRTMTYFVLVQEAFTIKVRG